jgi:ABC-2 type transport system ATP-binding protein
MIQLIKEVCATGQVHVVLSSHLLRDVEECCEEALIMKSGRIAYHCNLAADRQANKKFLMLELHGPSERYVDAAAALGIEVSTEGRRKVRMILPPERKVRDLYLLAQEHGVQIRHLDFKRDSLQDIFEKVMREN